MAGVVTHISSITIRIGPRPYLTITVINGFQDVYYGKSLLSPSGQRSIDERPRPGSGRSLIPIAHTHFRPLQQKTFEN